MTNNDVAEPVQLTLDWSPGRYELGSLFLMANIFLISTDRGWELQYLLPALFGWYALLAWLPLPRRRLTVSSQGLSGWFGFIEWERVETVVVRGSRLEVKARAAVLDDAAGRSRASFWLDAGEYRLASDQLAKWLMSFAPNATTDPRGSR